MCTTAVTVPKTDSWHFQIERICNGLSSELMRETGDSDRRTTVDVSMDCMRSRNVRGLVKPENRETDWTPNREIGRQNTPSGL